MSWRENIVGSILTQQNRLANGLSVQTVNYAQTVQQLLHPAVLQLIELLYSSVSAEESNAHLPQETILVSIRRLLDNIRFDDFPILKRLVGIIRKLFLVLKNLLQRFVANTVNQTTAAQYASSFLFVSDFFISLFSNGSFLEDILLGLRRSFVGTQSFTKVVSRAQQTGLMLCMAAFRAWLRWAQNRWSPISNACETIELGLLIAAGLQVSTVATADALLSGGSTIDTFAEQPVTNQMRPSLYQQHQTRSDPILDRNATQGSVGDTGNEFFQQWLIEQQRSHGLQHSSVLRRGIGVITDSLFSTFPTVAVMLVPRLLSWLQYREQQQRQQLDMHAHDRENERGDQHHEYPGLDISSRALVQRESNSYTLVDFLVGTSDVHSDGDDDDYDGDGREEIGMSDDSENDLYGVDTCILSPHISVGRTIYDKFIDKCNQCAMCGRHPPHEASVLPTIGLVSCYNCILEVLERTNGKCPYTGQNISTNVDIIRLFDSIG